MPQVFVSYAHESKTILDIVLNFANLLRTHHSIDVEIDQYEESPPEGWPKWMMRQVTTSKFVLVFCTRVFFERANDFSGVDSGLGVKWETNLILQELYSANTTNQKYIPVIIDQSGAGFIPLPLQPYTYYNISEPSDLEKLVARLKGISKSKRPELGEQPSIPDDGEQLGAKARKSMFLSSLVNPELWDKARWNGVLYLIEPTLHEPPKLGLWFKDYEYGKEIFRGLIKDVGSIDSNDELRISIIQNVSDSNPNDYTVHIGNDIEVILTKMKSIGMNVVDDLIMTISRIHTMNPNKDSTNLEMFKQSYSHFKYFYLTLVNIDNGKVVLDSQYDIKKKKIKFRTKQEIVGDKNDIDHIAIE